MVSSILSVTLQADPVETGRLIVEAEGAASGGLLIGSELVSSHLRPDGLLELDFVVYATQPPPNPNPDVIEIGGGMKKVHTVANIPRLGGIRGVRVKTTKESRDVWLPQALPQF